MKHSIVSTDEKISSAYWKMVKTCGQYYSATINRWNFHGWVLKDAICIEPEMVEIPEISFFTSGACGGDAGHGGMCTLSIMIDGGSHEVEDKTDEFPLRFHSLGDWELTGMAAALAFLGKIMELEGFATFTEFQKGPQQL